MFDGFCWLYMRDELCKYIYKVFGKEWILKVVVVIICLIVFIYFICLNV